MNGISILKKVHGLNKNSGFVCQKFSFFGFEVFSRPIPKKLQFYLEQRLLELAIPEFFELLYARKLLKKLQKLNLKVETLMFPSFSHNLGHSEETFFHKRASLKPVMRT